MNAYLNYIIEANLGLALFLGVYKLLLKHETDFKVQRVFLLSGIFLSIVFPLFHIRFDATSLPSLSAIVPPYLLSEITIRADGTGVIGSNQSANVSVWFYIQLIYTAGLSFFLIRFLFQVSQLLMFIKKSTAIPTGNLKIIEATEATPTFSFFGFIVVGKADSLSTEEKQKIIRHEAIHVNQLHSFDILALNILSIFFWFNPLLKTYKNIFVQLHEFEADARAVENRDVNEYCNLLAKVALESAGFKLANHFNNSLTLKRIEMMKTIKRKIKPWKLSVMASAIPLAFFILSCQDQVMSEVNDIAGASTIALDIPADVQLKYDALVNANPDKKYLLMETDENVKPKVDAMKTKLESLDQNQIGHIELITPTAKNSEPIRTFAIIEYTDQVEQIGTTSKLDNDVFNIVEETATPVGGIPEFYKHIANSLKYPAEARHKGVEGKVFIEFVIQTDGSLSDLKVIKGIGEGCDEEALDAIKTSPNWTPGKIKGAAVKQRMVLPISFSLGS